MTTSKQYKNLTPAERKAEVLAEIRSYHRKHGRIPKSDSLREFFHQRVLLVFPSWEIAVKEALGQPYYRKRWSDDEVLEVLRDLYRKNGRYPTTKDLMALKSSLKRIIRLRFGSLAEGIERAIGSSPRIEIMRVLDRLTPPGCPEASTQEIETELLVNQFSFSRSEVGSHLSDVRDIGWVNCRAFGKRTRAWSLTEKGREFLRSVSKADHGRRRH